MSASYAIIRSGILDYLIRGEIGYLELGIYTTVHLQADFATGIWWGSAPRLVGTAPRGTKLRDVQRSLQTLKKCLFLRPFQVAGKRGNYPVLINKYDVKLGVQKGKRLNAWKSLTWEHPVYEACAETVADDAPYQYPVSKKRQHPAAASQPPDPRHQPCYELAYESFRTKHDAPPTWNGKDQKNLKTLLNSNPALTVGEFSRRWCFYLASTEPFIAKQGDSLAFLCSRFDSFIDGPQNSLGGQSYGSETPSRSVRAGIATARSVANILGIGKLASCVQPSLPPRNN